MLLQMSFKWLIKLFDNDLSAIDKMVDSDMKRLY